jgi:hypothetical protein
MTIRRQIPLNCPSCGAPRYVESTSIVDLILHLLEPVPVEGHCAGCGKVWTLGTLQRLIIAESLADAARV